MDEWEAYLERQRKRREGPRAFPRPTGGNRGKIGWCSWCGDPIATTNAGRRGWHDGREDEPDCLYEFKLHTDREVQVAFVLQRDGPCCCDCGVRVGRWAASITGSPEKMRAWGIEWVRRYPPEIWSGEWVAIHWETGLELEHETPLWLVLHLPPEQRRAYFGPGNLKLRCPLCHKAKTKGETRARAKINRLQAPKRPGRKIASPGFDKTLRRRMNGQTERR